MDLQKTTKNLGRGTWTPVFFSWLFFFFSQPHDLSFRQGVTVSVAGWDTCLSRHAPRGCHPCGGREEGGLAWMFGRGWRGSFCLSLHSRLASTQTRHEDNIGKCFALLCSVLTCDMACLGDECFGIRRDGQVSLCVCPLAPWMILPSLRPLGGTCLGWSRGGKRSVFHSRVG